MDAQEEADRQLVTELRQEAAAYRRQWILWLGVGGAGGMVALLSFAANLPDPDYALRTLWPSLAAFALSIITAGPSLLLSSLKSSAAAGHYASASNRDRFNQKIGGMAQMFSAPQRMADEFNASRNEAIEQSKQFHERAEWAWRQRAIWTILRNTCIVVSSLSFVFGTAYPLYIIAKGMDLAPRVAGLSPGST
jgi:hypothetical protein